MFKRFLAFVLAFCMVFGCFGGAITVSANETSNTDVTLVASYDFSKLTEDGKIEDTVGDNDATILRGVAGNAPEIVDGALELNNYDTTAENRTILGGSNANAVQIPNDVFVGMGDMTIEMDILLHSSASSSTLICAGTDEDLNAIDTAGTNRNNPYFIVVNELWGSYGMRAASTTNMVGVMETSMAADVADKVGTEKWTNVKISRTSDGYTQLYIDGELVMDGTTNYGIPQVAASENGVIAIGRSHIFDPADKAMDGAIKSLKIYNDATANVQADRAPVAYYTLDGDLTDASGNGYTATKTGGDNITFVEDEERGTVMELNNAGLKRDTNPGANGIQIPTDGLKDATGFTLIVDAYVRNNSGDSLGNQVWFDLSYGKGNTDGFNRHYIVGMLDYSSYEFNSELSTWYMNERDETNRAYGIRTNNDDYAATTYDKVGEWAQLAYVNNNGDVRLYVDGVLYGHGDCLYSVADMLTVEGTTLTIGMPTFWPDLAMNAMIDTVAVYDYALTPNQLSDPAEPQPLPLELWYNFDEVSGTTVTDASGNGNDGTLLNGATVANDTQAKGNTLNLANEGITGGDAQGIVLPNSVFAENEDITIVMDIKLSDDTKQFTGLLAAGTDRKNYMILANWGVDTTANYEKIGLTNATLRTGGKEARIFAPDGTYVHAGEWTRVVYTENADGAQLYLNDKLVAEGTLTTTLKELVALDGTEVRIGSNDIWPDPGLDGRVDNIRVYSKVLTAEELSTIAFPYEKDPVGEVVFPELGEGGLRADYYLLNSGDLTYGDYQGTYVEPNIASSDMEATIGQKAGATDYVAATWTGRIAAPEDGNYTFYVYSDNGVRLWIDGELILDWWVNQWDKEQTSKKVYLEKGVAHDFKFEWFEYSGGSHVTLRWKNDQTLAKGVVPASAFYLPEGFTPPVVNELDTTNAQLDRGEANFGGELILKGKNLDTVDSVELVNNAGTSLEPAVYLEVTAQSADSISITVPDLKAGTYKFKLTAGDITCISDVRFNVIAAPGESDRPEHPNPGWEREDWISLNGWWEFAYDAEEVGLTEQWFVEGNKDFDLKINVPYPWESEMSGIQDTSYRGEVWYNRVMEIPEEWVAEGKTTHLYFGAVDAICNVYVNGEFVGSHNGGYTQFEFDITDYVTAGENTVTLWVQDEASYGLNSYPALVGKQGHNAPCGYTHTSGIWQTVYVESRTETYLDYAHANPNVALEEGEENSVQFDLNVVSDAAQTLTVKYAFESKLWNEELGVDEATGSSFTAEQTITVGAGSTVVKADAIVIDNAKWWSDTDPQLYYGTVTLVAEDGTELDVVNTYFGLREVYTDMYENREYEYIYLNGEPIFLSGLLDQGFWEEGIYTPPSEYAAKYDILEMKNQGFNMIRKHLKIEDPLQYLWCDKLGMFVWQDMPHATAMNSTNTSDGSTPGRPIYETALLAALDRDYNKPSIIAVMLFNETWGINHNAGTSADDGKTTHEWMEYLYYLVKGYHPSLLVEDMSACNRDHIQPTDLNTFHMYPGSYSGAYSTVKGYVDGAYYGSSNNFRSPYKQEYEPLLNSEYGGVGAYAGDYDVSLCFKYQTDIQRMYERMNGYVYTEPYDIEYERNGIMTYDRRTKAFPYGEIAYGGDMSLVDLNQPNYVGVDAEPAKVVSVGGEYSADAVLMNWSGDVFENAMLKWRFDATDIYGNHITTGISGEQAVSYTAYTAERVNITFDVPLEKCVGTLTVWVEQDGVKIAKNFVNIIVTGGTTPSVDYMDEDSVALRAAGSLELRDENNKVQDTGDITVEYAVPAGFDVANLTNLRVIAEVSSIKEASINNGISNSAYSQTTPGSERASDLTVSVNGVEIDTVYLPDNPRDIRGTLTINAAHNGGSSAGNFGYLVNINVPADKIAAVKEAIAAEGKVVVTYSVKEDAENANSLRIYSDSTGRYAVNPTVILNPTDLYESAAPESGNYLVTATLADGNAISLRGGVAEVKLTGTELSLLGQTVTVAEGEHTVSVRVFDDHYQVYVGNDPVPVIDLYDYTEYTDTTVSTTGTELVIAPESYESSTPDQTAQVNVQYVDHFTAASNDSKYSFDDYYTLVEGDLGTIGSAEKSNGTWEVADGKLNVNSAIGSKAVINGTDSSDVIVETDITLIEDTSETYIGNMGVIVRGSDYQKGVDAANGYYAGLGINDDGKGFLEVGKMHQGWTRLGYVWVDDLAYGETHRLSVVAVGSRIRVYVDGELYVDVYDETYTEGSVALRGFTMHGTYDNIVVSTAPRYDADFENGNLGEWVNLNDYTITDGTVSGTGDLLVGNAGWTDMQMHASVSLLSDDAVAGLVQRAITMSGKTSGYYVTLDNANDKVQIRKASMGGNIVVAETNLDLAVGNYGLAVKTINNNLWVYVDGVEVLRYTDNEFITGMAGLTTLAGTASFDDVAIYDQFVYEEPFNDGTLSGWSQAGSQISVADNTLTIAQGSNGDKIWDGYTTWSDYVLTVDMNLEVKEGSKSNAGFMFRGGDFTQGQDNYRGYVLGLNSYETENSVRPNEGSGIEFGDIHYGWRAIHNITGSEFAPKGGTWYAFTVAAQGNEITANVDGVDYYTVEDNAYTYGQFGLRIFCPSASFRNLKVTPANVPELPVGTGAIDTSKDPAVEKVIELIDAIGDVELGDEGAIKEAREAFDALTPEQQAKVTNLQKLIDAEHEWIILKAEEYAKRAEEAAEAAQKAYEDALKAAEEAMDSVAEDKEAAEKAAEEAEAAKKAAEEAQAKAEAAKSAAEDAKKAAEDANMEAAEKALEAAKSAAEAAESAQLAAEYAEKAADALKQAQEAQAAAEEAQKAAEEAQKAAEEARKAAEEAEKRAEEDRKAAEEAAEEAKKAAEAAELATAKYAALLKVTTKAGDINTDELNEHQLEEYEKALDEAIRAIAAAQTKEEVEAAYQAFLAALEALTGACPASKFTDVDLERWYHEGVDFMVGNGYMNGVSDTAFAPNADTTRAMLATLLYRAAGEPNVEGLENPFTDVENGKYYTDAVIWAAAQGIVTGRDKTTFDPNASVTRQEMVTMLWRFAGQPETDATLEGYTDAASVNKYAQAAFAWAVEQRIVTGVTKTELAPTGTASRAMIATVLMRYLEG